MTTRNARMIIAFLCLVLFVCFSFSAFAEDTPLKFLLSGETQSFVDIRLSSPYFGKLAQFDDSRVTALNKLLQHIALGIRTDGCCSATTVFIDNDPVYFVTEEAEGNYIRSVYSVDPDTAYRKSNAQESGNSFISFLDKQFFTANRMLDNLYNVFSKMEYAFPDHAKQSSSNVNYKGFGKAVRKVTIQFSSDDVRECFPGEITELTENDECCKFIGQYIYHGPQKITLLYNQENRLMNVVYNGILGLSEDTLRRVSLNWKCIREKGKIKDSIALKTPSMKGYDKYNVSYARELDLNTDEHCSLSWDFQLDYRMDNEKKKLQYDGDFIMSDKMLTGDIRYKLKQDGQESLMAVSSQIQKENEQAYQGTIEITNKKGKIVISSIKTLISAFLSGTVTGPDTETTIMDCDGAEGEKALESVRMKIYGSLMQKLITLPTADTEFLRDGIPEHEWNLIMQSMNQ